MNFIKLIKLIKLIKTTPSEINFLVLLSIFILVLKIFVLNRFVAPIFGMHEFGLILESVLASIIASYIFYLLVVRLKEVSDKRTIKPYIENHIMRIVNDCKNQLSEISKVSKVELTLNNFSNDEITIAQENLCDCHLMSNERFS